MATHAEIIYGPHARVRLIPSAVAICLALTVGTFLIAYFNVNGMRDQSGYMPPVIFFVFGAVFVWVYRSKYLRVTLQADGVVIERLFPRPHRIAFAAYSDIASVRQKRLSLKLELLDRSGAVLLVIPDTLERLKGELTPVSESSIPKNAEGILLELYQLRQEIALRASIG